MRVLWAQVRYRDAFGQVATAEDLDVFVEKRSAESSREDKPGVATGGGSAPAGPPATAQ